LALLAVFEFPCAMISVFFVEFSRRAGCCSVDDGKVSVTVRC